MIPDARQMADWVGDPANGDNVFRSSVMTSMGTALNTAAKSCTVSVSGQNPAAVINTITELKRRGHTITQVGTTLTIRWA